MLQIFPEILGLSSVGLKEWVGLFDLRLGLFYLQLVYVAYGKLAWSFSLPAPEFGLVSFVYGGQLVWSFLLTVPCPEMTLGLFCLRSPTVSSLLKHYSALFMVLLLWISPLWWRMLPRKILQKNPRQNPSKYTPQGSRRRFCRLAEAIFHAVQVIFTKKNCHKAFLL